MKYRKKLIIATSIAVLFWGIIYFFLIYFSRVFPHILNIDFRYPIIIIAPLIIGVFLFFNLEKIFKKSQKIITILFTIVCAISICLIPVFALGIEIASETDYLQNYLIVDEDVLKDEISQSLFPSKIPSTANQPEYHYFYYDDNFSQTLELKAQWFLSDVEYEKEKTRIFSTFSNGILSQNTSSGLTDYYIMGEPANNSKPDYYFIIFSFSDDKKAVQYFVSYSNDK